MRAIRVHQFGGPDVLKLDDVPDPSPGPGQVLVRVKAAGVNPYETYIRAGHYGPKAFPYTPGSDAGGVVERAGLGVAAFNPGDRVYVAGSISGTYAELALCEAANVHRLPANVTFAQGAAVGAPAATAWYALFTRGRAVAGETVLVHGATGGVGLAAVQLAVAAGLTVVGTAGDEKGRQFLLQQGAHQAVGHDVTADASRVAALTGGRGFDLIIEMLANQNLATDLPCLAKKVGRVIVVGSRGKIEIDPRDTMRLDADIRGLSLFNASDGEYQSIHAGLVAALSAGTLRPAVAAELPLAEAARAHEMVMQSHTPGKIVLAP